jgi:hypothetical protein
MSGGGLMQLVAYGAQDVYLTANPQVTFFKQLYRRHSNFAMESIEQTFNGVANFGKRVQCTISRNGDLISRVYLQATLPSVDVSVATGAGLVTDASSTTFRWVENVGQALISYVELEIGGQLIDKHYGDWMYIWNELTLPVGKQDAFDMMVGSGLAGSSNTAAVVGGPCSTCGSVEPGACAVNGGPSGTLCSSGAGNRNTTVLQCSPEYTLYVPLEFWFCRHSGLALPLIALQYHEVKVNIQFAELRNLCNIAPTNLAALTVSSPKKVYTAVNQAGLVAASLWADYVYLDTEERRRFAQVAHEYLIEQLQFTGAESVTAAQNNIKMSFNHPVKELVWVTQLDKNVDCNYGSDITVSSGTTYRSANLPFNYADDANANPTAVAKVQLNGHDRFDARFGSYFNFVQPYQHHTRSPAVGINVYSFALKPEEHQPSGTCNFSRIDNAVLNLTLSPFTLKSSVADVSLTSTSTPSPVGTALTAQVRIYAVNYNVLRVMSGMGGLAYSN